jgi:hypothetical protein
MGKIGASEMARNYEEGGANHTPDEKFSQNVSRET